MRSPIDEFIDETLKTYQVKHVVTPEYRRALKYKLAMAEITDRPSTDVDKELARDIILKDFQKGANSMRTAALSSPYQAEVMKSAGMCPRCRHVMAFCKLAESNDARFCSNCHVVLPS
jgi:hypothetical protein